MNTTTINEEKREYNDGTTDDIKLTRKVLGGMRYDIETIIRVQHINKGEKNTKTTYSTPYQELDPVTGKPINAFKPATHTGAEHSKTPEGLAGLIAARAPKTSGKSHNVVPVTTGPGATNAAAPAPSPATTQKKATFVNSGKDPAMAAAELYYESTPWGKIGHGAQPVSVQTFPGHRWFIVANGIYAKQFTIGNDDQQTYTI